MDSFPVRWAEVWARRLENLADSESCRRSFQRSIGDSATAAALQAVMPPALFASALAARSATDPSDLKLFAARLREWLGRGHAADSIPGSR
jgi:hypothetical protein